MELACANSTVFLCACVEEIKSVTPRSHLVDHLIKYKRSRST